VVKEKELDLNCLAVAALRHLALLRMMAIVVLYSDEDDDDDKATAIMMMTMMMMTMMMMTMMTTLLCYSGGEGEGVGPELPGRGGAPTPGATAGPQATHRREGKRDKYDG
jgi:hypothetical protein